MLWDPILEKSRILTGDELLGRQWIAVILNAELCYTFLQWKVMFTDTWKVLAV